MNLSDAQIAVLAEKPISGGSSSGTRSLRLREAGANVVVVAPSADQVYASKLGYPVAADLGAEEVRSRDLGRHRHFPAASHPRACAATSRW